MRWGGWTGSWKARRGGQPSAKDSKAEAFGRGPRDLPVSFAEVATSWLSPLHALLLCSGGVVLRVLLRHDSPRDGATMDRDRLLTHCAVLLLE